MEDLTHPIEPGMPTYPGDPPVAVERVADHDREGYRLARLALGTHTGTHVDAPAHLLAEGATLEAYDIEAFTWTCRRIDCRDLDAREAVTPDCLPDEDAIDMLAVWTGWDAHWGTDRYYDHPYLSPATARACAERGLAVAIDAGGPDPGPPAADWPAHRAILGAGELVVENLQNLGALGDRFELRAPPLRFEGDGAPVRAIGVPA